MGIVKIVLDEENQSSVEYAPDHGCHFALHMGDIESDFIVSMIRDSDDVRVRSYNKRFVRELVFE